MTTTEFKNKVNDVIKNENVTFESASIEVAKDLLNVYSTFENDKYERSVVYQLDDGYCTITDTFDFDFCDFQKYEGNAEDKAKERLGISE